MSVDRDPDAFVVRLERSRGLDATSSSSSGLSSPVDSNYAAADAGALYATLAAAAAAGNEIASLRRSVAGSHIKRL